MKNIFLSLLILSIAMSASTQTERIHGGAGHFRFGYSNYNMSAMNNWLTDNYPTLKNNFISVGGSGYAIINNVIIGGEGYGSVGSTLSRDTNSISPTIGAGMLNVGYIMYRRNHLLIYPFIGFGGAASSFKFKEVVGPNGMINKVKDEEYSLSSNHTMLSISIGADKFIVSGKEVGGFSVGCRIGYVYALQNTNWKKKDTEINGPNLNISGFYITIGIGGGGWSTK
jgi:opacity protein-like surface antigen